MGKVSCDRRAFLAWSAAAVTSAAGAALGAPRVSRSRARERDPGRGVAKVVVVGGGFAGSACALQLRRLHPALEVLLVDPDERYVTCPMSNSVIADLRAIASITVSRAGLARAGVHVVRDTVAAIDPERREARLSRGPAVSYDKLVLAAGIRFLWGHPEGYTESAAERMPHAWQAGVQTEILAAQLKALRPGGVVAISVPAGPMRCPPGPFERASLMAAYLERHARRAKVLIFDANNHFPRQDAFVAAWQARYPGTIEWIPVVEGGAVVRVDPARMTLYTGRGAQRADVINVIPAQAPASIAVQAGLASDHGWCPVDPATFESTLVPHVYVIGDACIADPMPKAASSASAQAGQCARAVVAALDGVRAAPRVLESVCYSLLAADRALAIHARFQTRAGAIEPLSPAATAVAPSEKDEARNASAWYRRIVAESFGGVISLRGGRSI